MLQLTNPKFQAFDDNGRLLVGGKLYTYSSGTDIESPVYSNIAMSSEHTNPIILDARGEATIYGVGPYKFILKDDNDVTIWTLDPISAYPGGFLSTSHVMLEDFDSEAGTGDADIDTAAFQDAIDYCKANNVKTIQLLAKTYYINVPLDMTSPNAFEGYGLSVIGSGFYTTIIVGNTGGIVFEITGSAWQNFRDFKILKGDTNPSTIGFFAAPNDTDHGHECLRNEFSRLYIDLQLADADISGLTYGSIGFLMIGSEENTFHDNQVYCSNPSFFTSAYNIVSTEYPSYYLHSTILASHSCGSNTFSGENQLVSYCQQGSPITIYSVNSLGLGNIYLGNYSPDPLPTGTTLGTFDAAINIIGGSNFNITGNVMIEAIDAALEIDTADVIGSKLNFQYGQALSNTIPAVLIHADGAAQTQLINMDTTITYTDPTLAYFVGKLLVDITGTPVNVPNIANFNISVNQTRAQCGSTTILSWLKSGSYFNINYHLTDTLFNSNIRTGTASPVGSVTPIYFGELYLNTDAGIWYIAGGAANTDWKAIN